MSNLSFNYKGEPFTPPREATNWRVRRLRDGQRGQLDVVRDPAGMPLILPIASAFEAFRDAVGHAAGRYRLDMVDDQNQAIDGESAYVTVVPPAMAAPSAEAGAAQRGALGVGLDDASRRRRPRAGGRR